MENSGKKKTKVSKEFLDSLKSTKQIPGSSPILLGNPNKLPPLPSPEQAKKIVAEMRSRGQIPPPILLPPEQAKIAIEQLKKLGVYPPKGVPDFQVPPPQEQMASNLARSQVHQRKSLQVENKILEEVEEDSIDKISYERNQTRIDDKSIIHELNNRSTDEVPGFKARDISVIYPINESLNESRALRAQRNSSKQRSASIGGSPKQEDKYNYEKTGAYGQQMKLRKNYDYTNRLDRIQHLNQQYSASYARPTAAKRESLGGLEYELNKARAQQYYPIRPALDSVALEHLYPNNNLYDGYLASRTGSSIYRRERQPLISNNYEDLVMRNHLRHHPAGSTYNATAHTRRPSDYLLNFY